MDTLIISVSTFLWFQWFWSQTQHVPLCWGHNAVLRHLCKQTVYFIYLFPAEYDIFQLRHSCDPEPELLRLTWRSWLWWPSCWWRFVGCCRGYSARWTGSSSSHLPEPRHPPSNSCFSLNHKEWVYSLRRESHWFHCRAADSTGAAPETKAMIKSTATRLILVSPESSSLFSSSSRKRESIRKRSSVPNRDCSAISWTTNKEASEEGDSSQQRAALMNLYTMVFGVRRDLLTFCPARPSNWGLMSNLLPSSSWPSSSSSLPVNNWGADDFTWTPPHTQSSCIWQHNRLNTKPWREITSWTLHSPFFLLGLSHYHHLRSRPLIGCPQTASSSMS